MEYCNYAVLSIGINWLYLCELLFHFNSIETQRNSRNFNGTLIEIVEGYQFLKIS